MRIKKQISSVVVGILLTWLGAVPASAEQESFIARGVGFNYLHWPEGQQVSHTAVLFEVEVSYDPESPLRSFLSATPNFHWWDQSLGFDLRVYSLAGIMLDRQILPPVAVPTSNYFPAAYVIGNAVGDVTEFGFKIPAIPGVTDFYAKMEWTPASTLPMAPNYPSWEWGAEPGAGNTFSMGRGGATKIPGDFQFTGFVSTFGSGDDTDGDGVAQGLDSCPESDLSPTVIFNGVDSGVDNVLDMDGCTLADKLAGAVSGARNHGQRVRAAGSFLTGLVREGLISGQQRGALLNAMAQTNK